MYIWLKTVVLNQLCNVVRIKMKIVLSGYASRLFLFNAGDIKGFYSWCPVLLIFINGLSDDISSQLVINTDDTTIYTYLSNECDNVKLASDQEKDLQSAFNMSNKK